MQMLGAGLCWLGLHRWGSWRRFAVYADGEECQFTLRACACERCEKVLVMTLDRCNQPVSS